MAIKWRVSLLILLSAASLPLRGEAPPAAADPALAAEVRQTVAGIISYTRWPHLKGPPRLCVFRSATYAAALDGIDAGPDLWQTIPVADVNQALAEQCDALYFGQESQRQQLEAIGAYLPRPLLTIAEQSADCTAGSAFCLKFTDNRVGFSVNLDSLSRSGVRVHPDVLMLASAGSNRHG